MGAQSGSQRRWACRRMRRAPKARTRSGSRGGHRGIWACTRHTQGTQGTITTEARLAQQTCFSHSAPNTDTAKDDTQHKTNGKLHAHKSTWPSSDLKLLLCPHGPPTEHHALRVTDGSWLRGAAGNRRAQRAQERHRRAQAQGTRAHRHRHRDRAQKCTQTQRAQERH